MQNWPNKQFSHYIPIDSPWLGVLKYCGYKLDQTNNFHVLTSWLQAWPNRLIVPIIYFISLNYYDCKLGQPNKNLPLLIFTSPWSEACMHWALLVQCSLLCGQQQRMGGVHWVILNIQLHFIGFAYLNRKWVLHLLS